MDNITHTLIGVTLAGALRKRKPESAPGPIILTSVIASNLPDADYLVRYFPGADALAYLLHHRGFTHTALLLPVFAAVSVLLAVGVPVALKRMRRPDWGWLYVTALLGVFFHVFADFWNSYGVHPLTPFWNQWFYGDFIFILEPFLWLSMLPYAFFEARKPGWKGACALLAAGIITVSWFHPAVTAPIAAVLSLWLVLFSLVQWKGAGLKLPVVGVGIVLLAFALGAGAVRTKVREEIALHSPQERITDIETSPAPGNPACWRFITVSKGGADAGNKDYIARIGFASLWPGLFAPDKCFITLVEGGTAPLSPVSFAPREWLFWHGEYRASWADLDRLAQAHCEFRAFLGFARIPFWVESAEGVRAGDLRYDRGRRRSFAERLMAPNDRCGGLLPNWDWPVKRNF